MYVRNTYETIPFVKRLSNAKQNDSLTKDQRVFVVNSWYETESCVAVQGLFRQRFCDREPPTRRTTKYA